MRAGRAPSAPRSAAVATRPGLSPPCSRPRTNSRRAPPGSRARKLWSSMVMVEPTLAPGNPFVVNGNMSSEPSTLADVFTQGLQKFPRPDRFLQKVQGSYQPISTEEFGRRVRACAGALAALGIARGDRVAI